MKCSRNIADLENCFACYYSDSRGFPTVEHKHSVFSLGKRWRGYEDVGDKKWLFCVVVTAVTTTSHQKIRRDLSSAALAFFVGRGLFLLGK